MHFAVELHEALPFGLEDQVELGELLVVVGLRVLVDVHHVDGGDLVLVLDEGAAAHPTGTGGGGDLVELGEAEALVHGGGMLTRGPAAPARDSG